MTSYQDAGGRATFGGIQALLSREAGYSVAAECLRVQAAAEAANPRLRSDRGVALAPDAWSWYVGTLGEIAVGEVLAELGPGWFVRHAIPIGAGTTDVDHLVIGPNGVFVLNTKRHLGANIWVGDRVMRVNGTNVHHVSAARHEVSEAARRLGAKVGFHVPVFSAVVTVGERAIKDDRDVQTRQITVVSSRDLVRWIRSQTSALSPAGLDLVRLAAEEPDTWHVDPDAANTLRVMPRFQRLREEIGDFPPSPTKVSAAAPRISPARSTSRSRSRSNARRTAPQVSSGRSKIHRSKAERVFWKIFFGVIGIPVLLFLAILLISVIALAFRG